MEKKVVVVTGGTRGIGQKFCHYFLEKGCYLIFTGTSEKSINEASEDLLKSYDQTSFLGLIADIRNYDDCTSIIEAGLKTFGHIDIFISNAGIDIDHLSFDQLSIDDINKVIDINLKGSMNSSHAILKYYSRIGKGSLYLMEGFGSDQRLQNGYTSYGTSKYAIRYLSKSLANEYKDTSIIIGNLSPGMVATSLLTNTLWQLPLEKRMKTIRLYNILADKPETVVEFLANKILLNNKNNNNIHWLTPKKIALRFLTAKFIRRNIIDKNDFI